MLVAIFSPEVSYSTTFVPQPFHQEVRDAPVIVRGKIGTSYADWGKDSDGTQRIYTLYELQVVEAFKGDTHSTSITIREMGGEKEGVGMSVAGTSQYSKGEDVVVFLKNRNPEGAYDVQGMMMGKFNIQTDEEGKEYLVGPALIDGVHSKNDTNGGKKWTVEDLRELVQSQKVPTHPSVPGEKIDSNENPIPSKKQALPTLPAAPQLQLDLEELDSPRTSWLKWIMGGLGIITLIALVRFVRRGESQR
jgi:hypothetical protein